MNRLPKLLARVAVVGGLALSTALAFAPSAGAYDPRYFTHFTFYRYQNTNSNLKEAVTDTTDGRIITQAEWRAGSGTGTNECVSNVGWLPAGWYTITGHYNNYDGTKIKGRVWQLSDKRCAGGTGTLRTELFIHSEETAAQGQYCPTAGDDPFCWEGTFDYNSEGCIKVAHATPYPSDIAQVHNMWDGYDGRHGALSVASGLYVYGP